jgi:uncharacterized integral membrane protein
VEGQSPERRTTPTWALVVFAALALYAILILVLNRGEVGINFVFFTAEISKIVLILLCFAIGFAAGYLFDRIRERRRRGNG